MRMQQAALGTLGPRSSCQGVIKTIKRAGRQGGQGPVVDELHAPDNGQDGKSYVMRA